MNHLFEDIEVKENALPLLEAALRAKRKPCMIGTGAMTDPYIPLEEELRMTRGALELIEKYGFGVAVQTKSQRILRDMDLLEKINGQAKAVVQVTLTTYDEELCRAVEPNVSTTRERAVVLQRCREAEIPTVVWLSPILPFINDTRENIQGILELCAQAQVKGIICFGMGVTMREGNREYFYAQLDRKFPGLKEEYIRRYGNRYELNSPYDRELMTLFQDTCERYGIAHEINGIFRYLRTFEQKQRQMSLFDMEYPGC